MLALRAFIKINKSFITRNTHFTRHLSAKNEKTGLNKPEEMIDFDDPIQLPIPYYEDKINESTDTKRARLLYQSRKRGMLENGLLLSTFAAKYLNNMTVDELVMYDKLINRPTNDWDIYYWATGVKPTPEEYDNAMMNKFKHHVRNGDKESRFKQPDLP